MENRREFMQFLIQAKKNTYAAGKNFVKPVRDDTKEMRYQEGDYVYVDAYYGDTDFLGQEVVWFRDRAFWGMNYYGRMIADVPPQGLPEFLKECLLRVPEFAPYRGPRYHRTGTLDYSCSWTGDVVAFQGKEVISAGGSPAYELFFHGGLLG